MIVETITEEKKEQSFRFCLACGRSKRSGQPYELCGNGFQEGPRL